MNNLMERVSDRHKIEDLIIFFLSLNIYRKRGNTGTSERMKNYLSFLFKNIDLGAKDILDVGSGYGLYTVFMALNGSKKIVSVEPELDGGINEMTKTTDMLTDKFSLKNIELNKELFQDLKCDKQFDLVLMHNCINHLNEEACIVLKDDQEAQKEFQSYFDKLYQLTMPNGQVIITDSSRNNLFGDLGMKNPMAPTIEYHKHQNVKVWQSFAKNAGFSIECVAYTPLYVLGKIGVILSANRLISYIGLSSFKLVLKKNQ